MTPVASPSAARRLSAENRREQILRSAEALFVERGFEGVGMADIALALGTSRPTVYTYFSSTEAILDELLAERLEQFPERFRPYLSAEMSFAQIFGALLQERELLMLLNSGGGPLFRQRRKAFLEALEARLNLRERGELKQAALGKGRQPTLLPIVLTLLSSMAYEQIQHGDLPEQELTATLDRFIRGGIDAVLDVGGCGSLPS